MGSNLVSSNILDGNGILTMPGSISVPNSGSFENKENTGRGYASKKIFLKSPKVPKNKFHKSKKWVATLLLRNMECSEVIKVCLVAYFVWFSSTCVLLEKNH